MRILHLTAGSDAGGLSRYIHDLCRALVKRGHSVAVAGQRGADHDLFAQAPWPWIDLPLKGGFLALGRSARQLRRDFPWDLMHVHYRRPMLVARGVARHTHTPILYTLHLSDLPLWGPWRWLSDFGDHTHAPSADGQRWLIERAGVDPQRISLIPHGVDPERFPRTTPAEKARARRQLRLPPQGPVALFVGRFDTPKNEDWLLDVARATEACQPQPHLLLVGGGPHQGALEAQIRGRGRGPGPGRGLQGRVSLYGYTDPLPFYQAADCLLLPSGREGFSLVCAEAMSTGLAILRTRTAGVTETVVEGITGRSVPIDRSAFVQAAVEMLQLPPEALARMGQAAAAHVRAHLSFERQVDDTIALYRRLCGQEN